MCVLKITFKEINKISNTSSKSVAKKKLEPELKEIYSIMDYFCLENK